MKQDTFYYEYADDGSLTAYLKNLMDISYIINQVVAIKYDTSYMLKTAVIIATKI